jgi:hypothetical protein
MANTQAMTTSFLRELLTATHNFSTVNVAHTADTVDSFKAALFVTTATINAATTAYSTTNEVTGTGYTAGGVAVTNSTNPLGANTSATAGVAYWTPGASISYTDVTLSTAFDTVLIYNSSQGDRAVSVHTFGSQTVTAGTFTLTMPANSATLGLLRLATT